MIDPYFKFILEEMKPLRDKVSDIDDKITMFKDLSVVFTRDNGKFYQKSDAVIEDNECKGYKIVNLNGVPQQNSITAPPNESTEATGSSTSKSVAISQGGKDCTKDATMNPTG